MLMVPQVVPAGREENVRLPGGEFQAVQQFLVIIIAVVHDEQDLLREARNLSGGHSAEGIRRLHQFRQAGTLPVFAG